MSTTTRQTIALTPVRTNAAVAGKSVSCNPAMLTTLAFTAALVAPLCAVAGPRPSCARAESAICAGDVIVQGHGGSQAGIAATETADGRAEALVQARFRHEARLRFIEVEGALLAEQRVSPPRSPFTSARVTSQSPRLSPSIPSVPKLLAPHALRVCIRAPAALTLLGSGVKPSLSSATHL